MTVQTPVLIMAGGTGGHIFPGLAVAKALRERGIPVVWLGSVGGMETRLVPEQGFPMETLAIQGLRGKGILRMAAAPWRVAKAVWKAQAIIRRHRPGAVVSFGGYTAGPGGLAAWMLGCPLLVHEQNRAPGLTNRLLAIIADKVMTGFPNSFRRVPHVTVGNPVRPEISAIPLVTARSEHSGEPMRVLVLGGSQGARTINTVLPKLFAQMPMPLSIRHQCGEKLIEEAKLAYQVSDVSARIEPFITDMAEAYAWADVVIGRAGALTVSEICAAGVASLLVPLPTAVDDHQAMNADFLKMHGAGLWFRQDEHLASALKPALLAMWEHPEQRIAMAQAAKAAAFPNAANDVADLIVQEMVA